MDTLDTQTIALIGTAVGLAGLMLHISRGIDRRFDDMNRRFDDMNRRFDDFRDDVNRRFDDFRDDVNRRFDDSNRANEEAHAHIASNISELRADFRAVIARPPAEQSEADREQTT